MKPKLNESNTALDVTSPRAWWSNYWVMIPVWCSLIAGAGVAWHFGMDSRIVASGLFLGAMMSHAFAGVVSLVALVPIVGPLIVKVLSIPIIWLLNACGYLVSATAIRRGYSKDVLTYRGLTIAMITGIVIGYIIGHYI